MNQITETEFDEILARALAVADEPVLELHIELQDIDLTTAEFSAPETSSTASTTTQTSRKSEKITIRIPGSVIGAFRAQAIKTRVPYQRLMNRALRAAAMSFV